jgi:hypothetical protein
MGAVFSFPCERKVVIRKKIDMYLVSVEIDNFSKKKGCISADDFLPEDFQAV